VKTFSKRYFNVYNVHNRWRTLVSSKNLYIRTFLTYSRRWGRRSLNRRVYVRLGRKTYRFNSGGSTNCHWKRSSRRLKQRVLKGYGYAIDIIWRSSPQGGYYSLTVTGSKATIGRCRSGYCCNSYKTTYRGKGKLKFGLLSRVNFKSRCFRKQLSVKKCTAYTRRYRNWRQRYNALVRCVKNRAKQGIKVTKLSCRGRNWLARLKFYTSAQAKAYAVKQCRHRNKFILYSCVYDRSVGIYHNRREYARLASYHFSGKRCISAGDPHMLTFGNRRFNVYNVHNKWKTLLSSKGFYAKTYMSYSRRWGRRSLNRRVYLRVSGKTYTFGPNGRSNTRWNRSNRNNKSKTIKRGGYRVIVSWNRSPQGGYYNVNVWANHVSLTKCSGSCCVGYKTAKKGKANLRKNMTLRSIKWKSVCVRKMVSLTKCRATYYNRRYRRFSNRTKARLIRNCVVRRKHL